MYKQTEINLINYKTSALFVSLEINNMPKNIINQLIKGEYKYQDRIISVPVKAVVIDKSVSNHIADLIKECNLFGRPLVVSDKATNQVLGKQVEIAMASNNPGSLVLKAAVRPDMENVNIITNKAREYDYIIAVGSGVVNDLCKYSSFLLKKPYVIFGTAPSMNGYTSANASIIKDNYKQTFAAHLPIGVFLDLDILAKAPKRLIRSGFGDSICRPTAQADWMLSHLLLGSFYDELPFRLLQSSEKELINAADCLLMGDLQAIDYLAKTLVLSGFGMYLAGGSYPASQGEHMLAHTMEMLFADIAQKSYHGEQIGVTTLYMLKLQQKLLDKEGKEIAKLLLSKEKDFKPNINIYHDMVNLADKIKQMPLVDLANKIENNWHDFSTKIHDITMAYDVMCQALRLLGSKTTPSKLGWKKDQFAQAAGIAKYTRDRFTFLDLL